MKPKDQVRRVNEIILTWNPIRFPVPEDEYEDLAIKILSKYSKEESIDALAHFMKNQLLSNFGLNEIDETRLFSTAELISNELRNG